LRGSTTEEPEGPSPSGPKIVLVCGVNGVGKTTTIGKLAHRAVREGQKVLVVAADTFRAAALEQLDIWAKRAGAEVVRSTSGADPAAVAFDGVVAGKARGAGLVIVDTAGRLQAKGNLMEELKKIHRVVGKAMPGAPHEVLLVLDATIGQNGLLQAREFLETAGVTGLVLAKLDGTAKGGVVLAIARQTGLPVRYVGIGEGIEDLEPFDPEAFAGALILEQTSTRAP
jgi:fused signal recognition particle receptor